MNYRQIRPQWQGFQESLLTNLLGNIQTRFIGGKLRNVLYRNIFACIGKGTYIQHGVLFVATANIEIANEVEILQGARINATGHPNNRVSLADRVIIEHGVDIRTLIDTQIYISENTYIGPYVCIAGPGNIKIGKKCLIAAHCGIYANNHIFLDPIQHINDQGVTREGIEIQDDCWLGHGVSVLDGITIGRGSVIGAGAVVTKDIPPFSVAVGAPARVIKSRVASGAATLPKG